MTKRQMEWVALAFFAALVMLVFQQIATSMVEQGIASGGAYDNAASYPRAIAIFLGGLIGIQAILLFMKSRSLDAPVRTEGRGRAIALLLVFGGYLMGLNWLGYHLSTAPMALTVMLICGARPGLRLVLVALGMAFGLAFIFEKILSVVLPGGTFGLNIPW
ncbi:tripartite tricarboxylate transporter TctB family protein [Paracoccus sp. Z330]|uniref:Tripartite tricarboxylate transporter TctB family protein n=1 Tax=Paracoccus onchidii TaxID=3017813 RepID=A0ABT4ZHK1_9RHOB|nr:tripartite tricarboxylate transporter TctB family protein [Paracoccus onchidii]MDB6178216.1 tripartite tricarboxylate transporter TctB family protein [Paracoccus onchidii]